MGIKYLVLLALLGRIASLPVPTKKDIVHSAIDESILSACELNIQKKCIEILGTSKAVLGNETDACEVQKLIDCFNVEKAKKECYEYDSGTVAYIDAYMKDVNSTKCMDSVNFTYLQELFKLASPGNDIEFRNVHRTYTSGDHDAFRYQTDDSDAGDDEQSGEWSSGVSELESSNE